MNNSSENVVPQWSSSLLQLKDELLAIGIESKEGISKQWLEDVDSGSEGSFFTADDLSVHSIQPKSAIVDKDDNDFSIITKKRSIKSTTNSIAKHKPTIMLSMPIQSLVSIAKPKHTIMLSMPTLKKSSKHMKEKKQKQKSKVSSSLLPATLFPKKKVKMFEKRAAKKEVSYYE